MAELAWSDNDGHARGRRVASVVWVPRFTYTDEPWGWEAYIARNGRFELVEVDGRRLWSKKDEAKAAAEDAHAAWLAVAGDSAWIEDAVDRPPPQPTGAVAELRYTVGWLRKLYRLRRERRARQVPPRVRRRR